MRQDIKFSLDEYIVHRVPTGGFLNAVLTNNLFEAFSRADLGNRRNMFEIVSYIYQNFPIGSYGSPKLVKEWLEGK